VQPDHSIYGRDFLAASGYRALITSVKADVTFTSSRVSSILPASILERSRTSVARQGVDRHRGKATAMTWLILRKLQKSKTLVCRTHELGLLSWEAIG